MEDLTVLVLVFKGFFEKLSGCSGYSSLTSLYFAFRSFTERPNGKHGEEEIHLHAKSAQGQNRPWAGGRTLLVELYIKTQQEY